MGKEEEAQDPKPNEVTSSEETTTRYTYKGKHWQARLSDKNIEKYSGMTADDRYEMLAKKMRLIPGAPPPGSGTLGVTLTGDLKAIRRALDNGELEGTRGRTLR